MSPLHILHLSPPPFPVPAAFSFYPPVFTYSFHPFYGRIRRGLSPFALLLTWVSVGGASRWRLLLRRQPIWACGVGGGEREREKRVEYEQNDRKKLRQPLYLLHQPRLADLKLISDISKQRGSQREGRATRSGFNKGCPPFHSHYRRAHIDRASARRVGALFHLFEWETKERPFVVLARVNLHKAITACNL